MATETLRLLLLEDNPDDAELVVAQLEASGYDVEWRRVQDEASFNAALDEPWDLVLSEYDLSQYDGARALAALKERDPDVPFILVTRGLEMRGVECMRAGALDYVLKDRLARLPASVEHALVLRRLREETARAQRQLAASEERLRLLIESSLTGIYVSDPAGHLIDCNPAFARTLGFSSVEEALRVGVSSLYERSRDRDAFLDGVRNQGSLPLYEQQLRTHDDRWIHVMENAVGLFDDDGQLLQIYGQLIDITERRDAELARARLADALVQAAEGIVITDIEGVIIRVNPAWERMTGYSSASALGAKPSIVKSGRHEPEFYEELWDTITAGETWSGKIVNRRRNGELFYVDTTISALRGTDGSIEGYMAFQKDVSREIVLENQLHAAQRLEAVGQLAAGIAHDFNNLMTTVALNAQLSMLDADEGSPAREQLQQALDAVARGRSLTQRLLAFGHQRALEARVVDITELVAATERIVLRTIPETIEFRFRMDPHAGHVFIDPGQLEAIILNLVINARDAMPDGGILTVATSHVVLDAEHVETHSGSQPGPHAVITVADTGHGMDEATLQHVFEPFFTTKEVGKGTGLGLAMVYGTVRQSGGSIWVYSEPGRGTTFKIYLPTVEADVDAREKEETRGLPIDSQRILVVEDDQSVRRSVESMLRKLEHTVKAVDGAEAALEALESGQYDLVITDVVMPSMTGIEMVDRLRSRWPTQPVVLMSGYSEDGTERLPGSAVYLEKPFTMAELARKVAEALGGHE